MSPHPSITAEPIPDQKTGKSHSEHVEQSAPVLNESPAVVERDFSERVEVSEEDDKRIVRKTDLNILTILAWVYWLQILDKSIFGFSATYGLKEDAHLVGNQYSTIGSINAIAQLAWMPFSSYLIVRISPRVFMPIIVVCWGAAMCGMAASQTYASLMATRFLLGLFEAGCLPLFAILTTVWYRRVEQPLRVCIWYGTNGFGTIMAAVFAYGFGSIKNPVIHTYQSMFLFCGLLTVCTAPFIYWRLDNNAADARFLSVEDKKKAVERLRANNTGTSATESFKWGHVWEAFLEIKTYLYVAMALLLNVGASVTTVFGPLIISSIGFDKDKTTLLNIPFGALQIICICLGSYSAYHFTIKSIVLMVFMLPVLAGLAMLYALPRDGSVGSLLAAYYLLAFLYAGNPLMISWISGNTAGSTKKSVILAVYNAAVACGNIIGPLLFTDDDAPLYKNGLKVCMGLFAALIGCVVLQALNLIVLNRLKRRQRVSNGKPASIRDLSMEKKYTATPQKTVDENVDASTMGVHLGDQALLDLTDRENDEFVYVY